MEKEGRTVFANGRNHHRPRDILLALLCLLLCGLFASNYAHATSPSPSPSPSATTHTDKLKIAPLPADYTLSFQPVQLGDLNESIILYVRNAEVAYYRREDRTTTSFYTVKLGSKENEPVSIGQAEEHEIDFASSAALGDSSYFYLGSFSKASLHQLNDSKKNIACVSESLGRDVLLKLCSFDGRILNVANTRNAMGEFSSQIECYCPEDETAGIYYQGNAEITEIIALNATDSYFYLFAKSAREEGAYLIQKLDPDKKLIQSFNLSELPAYIFSNRILEIVPLGQLIYLVNWNDESTLMAEQDQRLSIIEADKRLRLVRQQNCSKYPLFFKPSSNKLYYYAEATESIVELKTDLPAEAQITTALMSDEAILILYLAGENDRRLHSVYAKNPFQKEQKGE